MDLQNQQRVIDATKQYGAENVIVVLGSSDPEGAGLYAETVTAGDPTYAGPLSGVSLGLPVYHIFEDVIKAQVDQMAWKEQVSMMELVLDTAKLVESVAAMRDQHSKVKL